ncbi:MAG TPA: phospholipid carrier-dependent glycosyltransferase, partial [Spirochaetota bacterium]|nr:phospholipid carrier-dependent glycosyltransferase [Spirochaetota bacterium]
VLLLLLGITGHSLFGAALRLNIFQSLTNIHIQAVNLTDTNLFLKQFTYYFNGHTVSNKLRRTLAPHKNYSLKLPVNKGLTGSYGMYAGLVYTCRKKEQFTNISRVLDFKKSVRLPDGEKLASQPFYRKGHLRLTLSPSQQDCRIKYFFPPHLFLMKVKTNHNIIDFVLKNNNFSEKINVSRAHFILSGQQSKEGRPVSAARLIKEKIYTGPRFAADRIPLMHKLYAAAVLILLLFLITAYTFFRKGQKQKAWLWFFTALVYTASFFIYFLNYHQPASMFWDENYYLTAMAKYYKNIMFMSGHFPLGKEIIALGEALFDLNEGLDFSSLLAVGKAETLPEHFSFIGVRFFPVLAAMAAAILFFRIMYRIFNKIWYAFLFSFLFLLENAFAVHFRGAMLDSIQIFFILAAVLVFINALNRDCYVKCRTYFFLGILAGAALSVKENGAIILLLFPFLIFYEYRRDLRYIFLSKVKLVYCIRKTVLATAGVLLIFCGSWYIHFAAGSKLYQGKRYKASPEYMEILRAGEQANPASFFTMFTDNMAFIEHYHQGVPRYSPCNKNENGSLPVHWVVGKKSINYWWSKKGNEVRYRYLQINPLNWYLGLFFIITAFMLIGGRMFFGLQLKDKKIFFYITVFTVLYLVYMIIVMQADRVLYLYHYFIPFIFTLVTGAFLFKYSFAYYIETNDKVLLTATAIMALNILLVFLYFAPLAYTWPLTADEFSNRIWFDVWQLEYVR